MTIKNKLKSFYTCFIALLLVFTYSCEEEGAEVFNRTDFVSFNEQPGTLNITENEMSRDVEIGITAAFDTDVTITLAVTDVTAVQGVDYTLSSNTVTIPAGEFVGSFAIIPVDNDEFNESKTLTVEITQVSAAGVNIGHANIASYFKNIIIVNDDCPTMSNIWWGDLSIEDVGFGFIPGTGAANASGSCDVLAVLSDLPNGGITPEVPFELFLTPSFPGATSGTVDVPAQIYCTNCSAGLDAEYSASGSYDEATQTIILFYSLDRTDGANFWTGTNIIMPL